MRVRKLLVYAGVLSTLALAGCASESSHEMRADDRSLVTDATRTVDVLKASGGTHAADLLHDTRAVLIFPHLVKGGAGIGASRGEGVLLVRGPAGWSFPAFYESTSISLGLQLGGEESSVVMFVMSQRALDGLMHNSSLSLKASGGLSLVDFNTATQQQLAGADVVVWSESKGAYGGLSLSGSDIAQRPDIDRSYYGTPVTAAQIAKGRAINTQADALRRALGS